MIFILIFFYSFILEMELDEELVKEEDFKEVEMDIIDFI